MNENIRTKTITAQTHADDVQNGEFKGFNINTFVTELLLLIKPELLALVTTQEDKDKITAYFAEDV